MSLTLRAPERRSSTIRYRFGSARAANISTTGGYITRQTYICQGMYAAAAPSPTGGDPSATRKLGILVHGSARTPLGLSRLAADFVTRLPALAKRTRTAERWMMSPPSAVTLA